jgi:hypothetical protein
MELRTEFKDEDDRDAYYTELLTYPMNDVVARALDHFGWEIRPAPGYEQYGRLMMHDGGKSLAWADDDPEVESIIDRAVRVLLAAKTDNQRTRVLTAIQKMKPSEADWRAGKEAFIAECAARQGVAPEALVIRAWNYVMASGDQEQIGALYGARLRPRLRVVAPGAEGPPYWQPNRRL